MAPEVRAAERREALIRAATRVFGTVGFRKATVRSICQEAKLNDRYFYAAFDSTDDLLRCTYLHHAQQLHEAVGRAVAERGGDLHESRRGPPHSSRSCATRARRACCCSR